MQFYLKTFGCQMNDHDSEKMEASLRLEGHRRVSTAEAADLVIVNTCSIRERAYQKALSEIGRTQKHPRKNSKPGPMVAVTGCVASHAGENILKRFPFVDIVLGPDHESRLPQLIQQIRQEPKRFLRNDFLDLSDYEFPTPIVPLFSEEKKIKAYVTIMKGCDNVCAFCIVPFVRGKEVSRPSDDIVAEINRLQSEGVKEVMLLGQNVNSYGKGEKTTFPELLRRIDEETSINRIRFISPHPKDLSNGLIEEYGRNTKLCPHIHLPVQAGSNQVLKRMRRSYTREVYLRRVENLRETVPDIAITTDILVGFPGETDSDFEETLSLMREVSYDASYSFSFSPRPKTEAAQWTDDVPSQTKKERLIEVQKLQMELSFKRNQCRVGKREEVLVEGSSEADARRFSGLTPHGRVVNFDGDSIEAGVILDVQIQEADARALKGVLCS